MIAMPRKTRASNLETRTARLKLKVTSKPYSFTAIAPGGASLGYRRNGAGAGAWVFRIADGQGGYRTRNIALADDLMDADGVEILTWFQAVERGRKLAGGDAPVAGSLLTVAGAVDEYHRNLAVREAGPGNASRILKHLPPALAARPVALLTARELAAWRDGLMRGGMKPATAVRLSAAVKAALNLAAKRDHAIRNRAAWADGLSGVREDFSSRNIQRLDDAQTRAVIGESYALDRNFGLYVQVGAETGARPSQLSRLVVGDLQNSGAPRLMMPASRKGRGRKLPKYPVPISPELAMKLKSDREPSDPLLVRADGRRWQDPDRGDYAKMFAKVADRLGLDVSFYALRHSMIVRSLLAGVPPRIIAATTDTSTRMIERTYSSYVGHYADEIARRGLLAPAPAAANVIEIAKGRGVTGPDLTERLAGISSALAHRGKHGPPRARYD
jgi:integrase